MMRYRVLGNTGMKLSIVGLGGSGYGNVYGKYDKDRAIDAVRKGLDKGINYIDTAYWYGQGRSETFLGTALKGIPRERFFLGTKVGRYERDIQRMFDFSAEKVTRSAHESLERLQLSYVDILQVHDVEFAPTIEHITNETLPALQRLKEQGLCRYIGITGYPVTTLKKIIEQSKVPVDCILSYCRLTLNDSSLIEDFEFFSSRRVGIINASPVSMGLLTCQQIQPWHPATSDIRRACEEATKYCDEQGVDISHLAVNYSTGFEEAATTLVSMNDEEIMTRNMEAALNPLTETEIKVRDHIIDKYFKPLQVKHWEGVELAEYRKAMRSNN